MGTLKLAAHSFLNEVLLPRLASKRRVRALAVPHAWMAKYARDGLFDAALSIGEALDLPEPWANLVAGELRYGLFAAPTTASELRPSIDELRSHPFVLPVYLSRNGEVIAGDDRCPLPRQERTVGHEVETMALACRVAAETSCLVYGPTLAAAPLVAIGALVEIHVRGWSRVDPLYLACDAASVPPVVQDWLAATIRATFGAPPSAIVAVSGA